MGGPEAQRLGSTHEAIPKMAGPNGSRSKKARECLARKRTLPITSPSHAGRDGGFWLVLCRRGSHRSGGRMASTRGRRRAIDRERTMASWCVGAP
jgi:hypothetical protein